MRHGLVIGLLAGFILGSFFGMMIGEPRAGQADYAAVYRSGAYDCAQSHSACEDFRAAVARGWEAELPATTPIRCEPHPQCFSRRSECILGFNC